MLSWFEPSVAMRMLASLIGILEHVDGLVDGLMPCPVTYYIDHYGHVIKSLNMIQRSGVAASTGATSSSTSPALLVHGIMHLSFTAVISWR